ncbi:hypothetical protein [Catellatospora vulcania]|uniref:hypothetical protein n=1 Tax=Catellatospora vulcania TaxID=1460450 RepID=UPI0012D493E2|nr:hypothetical protein [Catellatospora vulcania]
MNSRDRMVSHLLLGVSGVAFFGTGLAILIVGGEIHDGPWWLVVQFAFMAPGAVILTADWVPRTGRRGLQPHVELPNLRLLLDRAASLPALPVTLAPARGPRPWWVAAMVLATAALAWFTWRNLHMPADPLEALRHIAFSLLVWAVFLLWRAGVSLVRRWRRQPAPDATTADAAVSLIGGPLPMTVNAAGLRCGSPPVAVGWSEVSAVDLLGPTPAEPETAMAVRWSLRGRAPIVVEADDMAQPPETAIRATWAYRPDLRWRPVDEGRPR